MTPASFLFGFIVGVCATVAAVVLAGGIFAAVLWREVR